MRICGSSIPSAMIYTIEIIAEFDVGLWDFAKHRLERMRIFKGIRLQARIKPYVLEGEDGPVEVTTANSSTPPQLLRSP